MTEIVSRIDINISNPDKIPCSCCFSLIKRSGLKDCLVYEIENPQNSIMELIQKLILHFFRCPTEYHTSKIGIFTIRKRSSENY